MAETPAKKLETSAKKQQENSDKAPMPIDREAEHLEALLRHIKLVQDACLLLGQRLTKNGEVEFGKKLIADSLLHDNSKFYGIEWKYMRNGDKEENKEMFMLAIEQHVTTNEHHPEHWGGLDSMPRIYVAEMVCDLYARSTEFGTDLRAYVKEVFLPKHNISVNSKKYKEMKYFIDLLLEKPFK
tara:strand:+ start:198 stop:749 length:552 start_codon:yes stop_codon:yes gene_type:complete